MTNKEKLKKKIEKDAERSVNRSFYELHEADARVRHHRMGANSLVPLLLEMVEALEFYSDRCAMDDFYRDSCGDTARKSLEKFERFVGETK